MRKINIKFLVMLVITLSFQSMVKPIFAQSPNWLWAKSAGGTSSGDFANSVATDALGNVYVTGIFRGHNISFESTTLTNIDNLNDSYDIYLAKYDADGNFLWAKRAGGTDDDYANSLTIDAFGNVIVVGCFLSPSITFGSTTLNKIASYEVFLAKYDPLGNVLWAKSVSGTDWDEAESVETDTLGNIFITGFFHGSSITFGTTTLHNVNSSQGADIFLAKYDASGNILWAKSAGGIFNDKATSVTTDNLGNVFIVGWFGSPTITFGSTTLNNAGNINMFFTKYDIDGNVLFAKGAGGTDDDYAASVTTSESGNIILAGYFYSPTIIFGTTTLINSGSNDIFLVKYDSEGNVLWAKCALGENSVRPASITIDAFENIFVAGYFHGDSITFGSSTLIGGGGDDIFLTKYYSNGNVEWVKGAIGSYEDKATSVNVDIMGNVYVTGYFGSPTIIFDSYTLTNAGTSIPSGDIFLAKLNGVTGISENLFPSDNIYIYPNPTNDFLTIETLQNTTIEVYNTEGQIVKKVHNTNIKATFNLEHFKSGVYIVKARSEKGIIIRKFIKY